MEEEEAEENEKEEKEGQGAATRTLATRAHLPIHINHRQSLDVSPAATLPDV